MTLFYIAQIFSFLSAVAAVVAMQCKSMRAILVWQALGNFIIALSYFFLGGISGGLICLFAVGQGAVMYLYNKNKIKPHAAVRIGFILVSAACSAVTGYFSRSFAEIFSAVGAILYTISIAQQKPAVSRLIFFFNPICWMCYDIFTQAYVSFFVHLAILISTAVGIVRMDIPGKKKAAHTEE